MLSLLLVGILVSPMAMLCYFKPTCFHLVDPNGLLSAEIPLSLIGKRTVHLVGREAKCQCKEVGPGTIPSANWQTSERCCGKYIYSSVHDSLKHRNYTGYLCCHFVSICEIHTNFVKGLLQDFSKRNYVK